MATPPKPETTHPAATPDRTVHRVSLRVSLDGIEYRVKPVRGDALPRLARRGFRLTRTDAKGRRFSYVVTAGPLGLSCTCPSPVYRSGAAALGPDPICKHARGLAAMGILP